MKFYNLGHKTFETDFSSASCNLTTENFFRAANLNKSCQGDRDLPIFKNFLGYGLPVGNGNALDLLRHDLMFGHLPICRSLQWMD